MLWLIIILIFICLVFCWLLFSPLVFEIDTRIPTAKVRWVSVGSVQIWFEEEWMLKIGILFYKKNFRLSEIIKKKTADKKKKIHPRKRKIRGGRMFRKISRVLTTFTVSSWEIGIDTGDYTRNAQLYPMNFLPFFYGHVQINFLGENYLYARIRNSPSKMIYAFLR